VNSLPAAGANPSDEANRLSLLAMAHHDLGHAAASQKALDALIAKAPAEMVAYVIARVYAWRGDRDRAFNWLERAFAQRDTSLSDVKWTPSLRKLRDDSRYTALLKKMNLPLD
jgi:tetratricopeptide (TPR) repeat protein